MSGRLGRRYSTCAAERMRRRVRAASTIATSQDQVAERPALTRMFHSNPAIAGRKHRGRAVGVRRTGSLGPPLLYFAAIFPVLFRVPHVAPRSEAVARP